MLLVVMVVVIDTEQRHVLLSRWLGAAGIYLQAASSQLRLPAAAQRMTTHPDALLSKDDIIPPSSAGR